MAMEVVCGNCQGRLLVEQSGVVVACPHCGAHLQIGEPPPPAVPAPPAPPSTGTQPQNSELPPGPSEPPTPWFPPAVTPPTAPANAPQPASFAAPMIFAPPSDHLPPSASDSGQLPEIILTPPAKAESSTTDASSTSLEKETGVFTRPGSFEPPAPLSDNDSWLPKIDLAMPPRTKPVDAPALPAVAESSTLVMPVPAAPNPQPVATPATDAAAAKRAGQTDIWSRSPIEESYSERPTMVLPAATPAATPTASTGFEGFAPAATDFESFASPTITPTVRDAAPALPTTQPSADAPAGGPTIVTSDVHREAVVPRYLFVIVASYASAITIAFLYLWWRGSVSTLDLPDLVPAFKNNKVGLSLIKETPLPPAYRLKLGETRRYGNVQITPLKVTKGPLEFTYFNNAAQTKPATNTPVLKLWVKFENVSSDQTFPALDEHLLFLRVHDRENATQDRTNNYVCQQSERKRSGKRVPVYAFPINGEWLLKDQNLNTPIGPQEEWETYVPTNDEDLSSLEGPLTWRLHFRKGYNPKSFRGVTTLVEVEFDSKDIQAES